MRADIRRDAKLKPFSLLAILLVLISIPVFADSVPLGYISYDVVGTNLAEFDIYNLTGPNSFYPDFPISNSVSFSNLSLVVDYANGSTVTLGPSYFTLSSDGLSFMGTPLSTIEAGPSGLSGAVGAVLTGTFDTSTFLSADGTVYNLDNSLSVSVNDPSGLKDGDLAVIDASSPEPSASILAGTGLIVFFLMRRKLIRQRNATVAGFVLLCCVLLLDAGHAEAQNVTLTAWTSPTSGAAGTTAVNITGSGFPSGTIPGSDVTVSLEPASTTDFYRDRAKKSLSRRFDSGALLVALSAPGDAKKCSLAKRQPA